MRKLPFQNEKRGKRLVWCLLFSEVPFLYSLFGWKLVAPERSLQLRQASKEQMDLANLAYEGMQKHYRAMRQALFTFLSKSADFDMLLQRHASLLSPTIDDKSSPALSPEQGWSFTL